MQMKRKILLSLTLLAAFLLGCRNQPQAPVKISDNSGTIVTKVGEIFMITLESNITTGYSWRLAELKPGIVEQVSNVYKPFNTQERIVGSGGVEEWTFKAVAKGNVAITLEYVRPWEKDVPPIKKSVYQVSVK